MSHDHASSKTFSDAWHRVADVRARLRDSVASQRQFFRGEPWILLRDQFSSEWFRVTPDAYDFLCRLGNGRTVDEAWSDSLAADADRALTQEEVVQLLGSLNLSNLLQYDRGDSHASQFKRLEKRKSRELRALLLGVLSIKLPLLDPDRMLERALPLIRAVYSRFGLALYLGLLALGAKALMDESHRLFGQSAGLLAPSNIGLLYVGFLIAKLLHELSHAAVCKLYGGEVHQTGVMLLMFAPIPYVDATAAWGFRSRAQRLFVGAAGVVAELAVAAIAALLWANTAPGVVNALAYNVIFAASVSTLLFNLNPLLRFDGYHMLVDLIDVPNLFQRSREQLRYLGQRFVLRLPQASPAARTRAEVLLLPLYGVASLVYWLLLMSTIIFVVAEQYLDLGVALALLLLVQSLLWPLGKFCTYLLNDPQLGWRRGRAIRISIGIAAGVAGLLGLVPMPDRIRVSGVVEAERSRQIHIESEGFLAELLAKPGARVELDQPLLRLVNPELDFEISATEQQLEQLQAQRVQAVARSMADLAAIERQQLAVEQTLADLLRRRAGQLVRAPIAGVWSASDFDGVRGQWIGRGVSTGTVVGESRWRFVAVLPQVGSYALGERIDHAELRIKGEEGRNIVAVSTLVLPFEQGMLPSPALGMAGGGEIAVASTDPKGLTAAEPFFRIESTLPVQSEVDAMLVHGRTGTLRLTLADRPLLQQWGRRWRQFMQRRFRV
jgi:putative peptide zinc metalloprotease protein